LHDKIHDWVQRGLITSTQAHAIVSFESQAPEKNWAIIGIAGVGVTAFITGVIGLVAGNWETISTTSKILAYFMIQIGLGAMFLASRGHHGLLREISLSLFALFFLCGIGMISQIYSLDGQAWQIFMFWIVLVLPATLLAHNRVTYHFWVMGFYTTIFIWLFFGIENSPNQLSFITAFTVTMIYIGFTAGIWRFPFLTLPDGFRHACLTWSIVLLLGCLSLLGNLLWYDYYLNQIQEVIPNIQSYLSLPWIACVLGIAALGGSRPRYHTWFRNSTISMLVLIALYLSIPLKWTIGQNISLGFGGFMFIWGAAAAAAAFSKRRILFDIATLVIATRFILFYLELFGSATETSVGLMVSGTLVLAVAYVWHRYRRSVETWLAAHV